MLDQVFVREAGIMGDDHNLPAGHCYCVGPHFYFNYCIFSFFFYWWYFLIVCKLCLHHLLLRADIYLLGYFQVQPFPVRDQEVEDLVSSQSLSELFLQPAAWARGRREWLKTWLQKYPTVQTTEMPLTKAAEASPSQNTENKIILECFSKCPFNRTEAPTTSTEFTAALFPAEAPPPSIPTFTSHLASFSCSCL